MAGRRRTQVRKQPAQERARVSVDAILVAAMRVLDQHGLDKLTTARIAEVAGVSVGTLYQYFPSKEAILGVLVERRMEELLGMFQTLLDATLAMPIDAAIRAAIQALVTHNQTVGRTLHAPYVESVATTGRSAQYRSYMMRFADLLAAHLERRKADLRITDYATGAFVLVSCADGIAQNLAYQSLEPAAVQRLSDEATALVAQYLIGAR
jgi:AcrR family transcriptional regulator